MSTSRHERIVTEASGSNSRDAAGEAVWHGLTFLLVEDNPDHQTLVRAFLKETGVAIFVAPDGEEAIRRVEESLAWGARFDLVLMDIRLPRLDGYEATRRLRELGYSGPIVALTAHAFRQEIEKCHEAGCGGYIRKPFDRAALLGGIAGHLPATKAARSFTI